MPPKNLSSLTIADLLQWQAIAIWEQPQTPAQHLCEAAPEIRSYTTVVRGNRIGLVAKLDNGQTVIWNVNPFLARNLALNILAIGQQMQWLDQNNEILPTQPME